MAITSLDLKFRQSQRMTDFDDGGGRMSSVEIVDGALNNVFSDLSDANAIIGNVSLRKLFAQVDTANTDTFLGPFFFLTDPPVNATVTVLAFNTLSATDEREDARNYVESYRIIGVKSRYTLYGDHFSGQMTVQVYCRSEAPSPDIGDVLCLSIERDGYTPHQQFVAVQAVASRTTQTFTDGTGDFQRDVLILQITSGLQYDFPGQQDPTRIEYNATPPTLVRTSQVNGSAKFYGMAKVTEQPHTGDSSVKVDSPYLQIVPTSQGETPVVDQLAGLGTVGYVPAGASAALTLSWSASAGAGEASTRYLGSPYVPGTLAITIGSVSLRDDGHGGIEALSDTDTGWSGAADYGSGLVSIARDSGFSGSVSVTATPAGAIAQQTFAIALPIIAANRNISQVFQIPGQPSPGTVTVDFLALGKWIRLSDNGRGRIEGNPGEGSATINYATSSVALTLGALPDVDSAILVAWGTDLRARNSAGEVSVPTPSFRQALDHAGVKPGSLTMTWTSGAASKTASADSAGAISGDAIGYIDCTAGIVEFTTAYIPDTGEQFHYAYTYLDSTKIHSEVFTLTAAGGAISVTLANAPKEYSAVARWNNSYADGDSGQRLLRAVAVRDDGSGGWTNSLGGTNIINYSTGAIVLTVE